MRMHRYVDPIVAVDLPVAIATGIAVTNTHTDRDVVTTTVRVPRRRKRRLARTGDWTQFLTNHPVCGWKSQGCTHTATVITLYRNNDKWQPRSACANCAGTDITGPTGSR